MTMSNSAPCFTKQQSDLPSIEGDDTSVISSGIDGPQDE
jgi:hypothetical protein